MNQFDRIDDDEEPVPPLPRPSDGEVTLGIVGLILAISIAIVVSLLMVQSCSRPAPAHQGARR